MNDAIPDELCRGKTKIISRVAACPGAVEITETDRMTAGNGARDEMCPRKGEYSTTVNHHAMSLLRRSGQSVSYVRQTGPNTRIDIKGIMFPYEVVVIREVTKPSSLRKREPNLEVGTRFDKPRVAFFLKTKERTFAHYTLPDDDPLIVGKGMGGILVCHPGKPEGDGNPLIHISAEALFGEKGMHPFEEMERMALDDFLVLEHGWAQVGWKLCDWKGEFALGADGRLMLADTIDPDSCRLLDENGQHKDKQPFREQAPIEVMAEIYREVAERITRFDEIDRVPLSR